MKFTWENINRINFELDENHNDLKSYKEEVRDYIVQVTKNKEVILIFSGGNDSRFIARQLIDLDIPFKAVTKSFKPTFDDYDAVVSKQFCLTNGIEHDLFYEKPKEFFMKVKQISNANHNHVYAQLVSYYIETLMQKYRSDGFTGVFLSGCGMELHFVNEIKKPEKDSDIYLWSGTHPRQLLENNKQDLYTAMSDRIYLSYIRNKICIKKHNDGSSSWIDIRNAIYQESFEDLVLIKKQRQDDLAIEQYYVKNIIPYIKNINCLPFITEKATFNLSDYYRRNKLL